MQLKKLFLAGITNMAIVTGRGKRAIEDHFDNSFELESQLSGTQKNIILQKLKIVIERCDFYICSSKKMLDLDMLFLQVNLYWK